MLKDRKCVPCEGGIPKLGSDKIEGYLRHLQGWRVEEEKLRKTFSFKNFMQTMGFLTQVALLAEAEGHHPDFCVHYSQADFTIWTHAIGGLSENDFILAAKIDGLVP